MIKGKTNGSGETQRKKEEQKLINISSKGRGREKKTEWEEKNE